MNESVLYEINLLKDFCNNVLLKVEVESENSEMITDSLICADLRGVKSHGIVRLPTYVERIEKGILDPKASMKFEKNAGAISRCTKIVSTALHTDGREVFAFSHTATAISSDASEST